MAPKLTSSSLGKLLSLSGSFLQRHAHPQAARKWSWGRADAAELCPPWRRGFAAAPWSLRVERTPSHLIQVCFHKVSDNLGMLETKQHLPHPHPHPHPPTVPHLLLWFRLLSGVTNFVHWNQGLFVWVFPLLLIYLKVPVSYFRFLLIVCSMGRCWNTFCKCDFFFSLSFAWSLCHNVSCCCLLPLYEVPNVSSRTLRYLCKSGDS